MSREKVKLEINVPVMSGHVSSVKSRCGNRACDCYRDEGKMHGPYFRWTGMINGKRITKNISREVAKECERRIKNYRKLLTEIERALEKSFRSAPWDEIEGS